MLRKALAVGASGAAVAGVAYCAHHYCNTADASPFVYPALTVALERRRQQEQAARRALELHAEKSRLIRQRAEKFEHRGRLGLQLEAELAELEGETKQTLEKILFGSPGRHRQYLQRYGCAKWTDTALERLAAYAPLIEVGAGRGLWALQLRKRNVDIVAFDDMSAVPLPDCGFPTPVLKGDQKDIPRYPDRTLFLCYPPAGGMARDCLLLYRGRTFIYVGEGRGGVNASPDFFDLLQRQWDVVHVEDLDPYPGGVERFWVLQRKAA